MDINVWANKLIIDDLAARHVAPRRIVLISSGAGVVGNHGWGAYALSKAALNMLAQLYAHELPSTQSLRSHRGWSTPPCRRICVKWMRPAFPR